MPSALRSSRESASSKPSVQKLPDALSRPDLEIVALDYFRRLQATTITAGSPKLYAWEEKKSKASWAGRADRGLREDIAAAALL